MYSFLCHRMTSYQSHAFISVSQNDFLSVPCIHFCVIEWLLISPMHSFLCHRMTSYQSHAFISVSHNDFLSVPCIHFCVIEWLLISPMHSFLCHRMTSYQSHAFISVSQNDFLSVPCIHFCVPTGSCWWGMLMWPSRTMKASLRWTVLGQSLTSIWPSRPTSAWRWPSRRGISDLRSSFPGEMDGRIKLSIDI